MLDLSNKYFHNEASWLASCYVSFTLGASPFARHSHNDFTWDPLHINYLVYDFLCFLCVTVHLIINLVCDVSLRWILYRDFTNLTLISYPFVHSRPLHVDHFPTSAGTPTCIIEENWLIMEKYAILSHLVVINSILRPK